MEEMEGGATQASAAAAPAAVVTAFESTGGVEPDSCQAKGGVFSRVEGAAPLVCCGKSTAATAVSEMIGGSGGGSAEGDAWSRVPRSVLVVPPSTSCWGRLGERGLFLPKLPPPPPPPLLLAPFVLGLAPLTSTTLAAWALPFPAPSAGAVACAGAAAPSAGGGDGRIPATLIAADSAAEVVATAARPAVSFFCAAARGTSLPLGPAAGCVFGRFAGELRAAATSPSSMTAIGVSASAPSGLAARGG